MKFFAKNPSKLTAYHYPEFINGKDNFRGHQIGIALAIKNSKTNEFVENFLHNDIPDKENALQSLLADPEIETVEAHITAYKNGKLVPETIYYLPYIPENHSTLKPTETESCIDPASNVYYNVEIEIMFLEDEGYRRYVTMHARTVNIGIMDLVRDLFEESYDDKDAMKEAFPDETGFFKKGKDDQEEKGHLIDYYDNAGNCVCVAYLDGNAALDKIASIRMLKCECVIKD